ncbi:MAG: hypothetical protein EA392_02955 [Cryomorphaceae bacterium]|nr:MAG: hypothetical protein EA392_02955 [Cryomorphaceae bacterium]
MIHEIIHRATHDLDIDGIEPLLIYDTQGLENLSADETRKWFIYIPVVQERSTMQLLHYTSYQINVIFAYINQFAREGNEKAEYYKSVVSKLRKARNDFFLAIDHMKNELGQNISKLSEDPINSVIVHQDTKFDVPATIIQSTITIEVINYAGVC